MASNEVTVVFKEVGLKEVTGLMDKHQASLTKLVHNTNGTVTATGKINKAFGEQAAATNKVAAATDKASRSQASYFAHIAKTTVQSALVNKVFLEMADAMGQAVRQADLIENFPASMEALGISAEVASRSFEQLRFYVQSVGGDLTTAAAAVSRFAAVNKNVEASVGIFAGVNNALIAGAGAADAQRAALEQLIQGYSRGVFEGEEFRSLLAVMGPQIQLVAEELGRSNTTALRDSLTAGEISMNQFITTLSELSTTGPIADQALARMQGIEFAANVMRNTLINSLTAIYREIGRENITAFFSFLTQVIRALAAGLVFIINLIRTFINLILGLFGKEPLGDLTKDAGQAASNLNSGVEGAKGIGDGLDDAGKKAKALNKQLAGFDQMNVLRTPTESGGSGGDGGGRAAAGAGFDPGELGILEGITDGINRDLGEIGKRAKIFAALLGGFIGKKLLQRLFATPPLQKFGKVFKKSVLNPISNFGSALGRGLSGKGVGVSGAFGKATALGTRLGLAIRGGMIAALSLGAGIGPAIGGAFAAGAAALGVSMGTFGLIVAGAVAAIVVTIKVISDNWDAIVGAMTLVWETFAGVISSIWEGAVKELTKQWDKLYKTIEPTLKTLEENFESFKDLFRPMFKEFKDAIQPAIDKLKELYEDYIKPLVSSIKEWVAETGVLKTALQVFGVIIAVIVVAPLVLLVAVIGIVVALVVALAAAFVWVIAKIVEFANYVISGGLWEDIQGLIDTTTQWLQDKFNEAVDFVKNVFSTVANWFKENVWDKIVEVFSNVGTWFEEKFQEAWDNITKIFSSVADWFGERFENARTNIYNAFKSVGTWFRDKVWNKITEVFSNVKEWFKEKFRGAWDGITSVFSGVKKWFKDNVIGKISEAFVGIKDKVGGFFSGIWDGLGNGLKNALNTILKLPLQVPSVSVAGKTIGGQTLIPRLARGGVVDQATIAMIGEDGSEAVVPLENNTEWIDRLAYQLNDRGQEQPTQINIQIGEEQVYSRLVDLINERTLMSGRSSIAI